MSDNQLEYHIQMKRGDVGRYVFLPGDPQRAKFIASHFDEHWKVAENREFVTYSGYIDDILVSVCSTGIGSPSTAIAVEELAKIGGDTFIRIGTAGILQENIKSTDVVIATAAIRDEGTTRQYLPIEYPAVANFDVVDALNKGAKKLSRNAHLGVVQSKDSFYYQHEPETMPISKELKMKWNAWTLGGALASEMEAAALFIVASVRNLRAGCILNVLDYNQMSHTINIAIEGVKMLAKKDEKD